MRKAWIVLGIFLTLCLLLSACDSDISNTDNTSSAPTSSRLTVDSCTNGHTFSDDAVVCARCGLDYFSATLEFTLSKTGDSYIVSDLGACVRTVITIPETHNSLPVTEIGWRAFSGLWKDNNSEKRYGKISEVKLPSSITKIGAEAFYGCTSLKSINIPEGITAINDCAFGECVMLDDITLPNSLITIGESTFAGCSTITEIIIPENVTQIGSGAFGSCKKLSRLELPKNIVSLNYGTIRVVNLWKRYIFQVPLLKYLMVLRCSVRN